MEFLIFIVGLYFIFKLILNAINIDFSKLNQNCSNCNNYQPKEKE